MRSIGAELDPSTRQAAEAFAFEGRTAQSANAASDEQDHDESLSSSAVIATGRAVDGAQTVRRAPLQTMRDAHEAEERQRLGEEYLARRNQQMMEMKQRRSTASPTVRSPEASFESLVDSEGKLKQESAEIKTDGETIVMKQETSNPFSDEHELERSTTPRPPVPPKIKLEEIDPIPEVQSMTSQTPGAFPDHSGVEEMSYEEQLARAISLSEQDVQDNLPIRDLAASTDDAELKSAIEASLREMYAHPNQLVDVSEDASVGVPGSIMHASEEDLYSVTPNLTRARLAHLDAQQPPLVPLLRTAPAIPAPQAAAVVEPDASFYSAHDTSFIASSMPSLHNGSWLRPVRDNDSETLGSGHRTPTEASVVSYPAEEERLTTNESTASSASHSSMEIIDVEDIDDAMSEDGIPTPDSWTEVGSQDGESEHEQSMHA